MKFLLGFYVFIYLVSDVLPKSHQHLKHPKHPQQPKLLQHPKHPQHQKGKDNNVVVTKGNNELWKEFKTYFNKTYSPNEDAMRKTVWDTFLNFMYKNNLNSDSNHQNYTMGLNEFSDLSPQEFRSQMMGLDAEKDCQNSSLIYQPPADVKVPDSVDLRKKGLVTPIKNQGLCNACWAFVSIGSLEGQHKRITGQLVSLSEQQLIDCSEPQGNSGCGGGQMCRALEYAANSPGVATEKGYPFIGNKTDGMCHLNEKIPIGSPVGGYLEIPKGEEDTLKKAVGLIGPVAAGIDGSPVTFQHYKSGIYSDPSCSNTSQTHAVTVIGYGTENGTDYWLIKNSWGTTWGEKGFAKLLRNRNNHCGIASQALFPVVSKNKDGTPELSGPPV